jgi:hypothetical protein
MHTMPDRRFDHDAPPCRFVDLAGLDSQMRVAIPAGQVADRPANLIARHE